tara:strand:- start:118 stop:534 length:417 start_codon:yes stop_codon:yes gene_type:complete
MLKRKKFQAYSFSSFKVSSNFLSSFKYAFQGIFYTFKTQRNFRVHICLGFLAFVCGIWIQLNLSELSILFLTISSVIFLELINTSLESIVDLSVGKKYNKIAKISKDCAAGAVFVASLNSLIVAILLLLPPLYSKLTL